MRDNVPLSDWRRNLIAAAGLALLLLALLYTLGPRAAGVAQAQSGTLRLEIDKRLEGSDVVRVGQLLTFTIRIVNTGTITVTKLPLDDVYKPNIIQLERTIPPPSQTGPGEIHWTDLTTNTLFGPLAPGQEITIITVFRAIAPSPETVNAASIGAAVGSGGETGGGNRDQDQGESKGGNVIITKTLDMGGAVPRSGLPITFTIEMQNEGAADLVSLPLQDTYDTSVLRFWWAAPAPARVDLAAGELRWDDVLPALGLTRLRPNEVVRVTTVFTALKAIDPAVINRARSVGARDEFANEVPAPRRDDVPIRIIPGPGEPTPTSAPTATRRPRAEQPSEATEVPTPEALTPTPEALTPTAELSATAGVAATADAAATAGLAATTSASADATATAQAQVPARLPRTGAGGADSSGWLLAGLALLLGGALALLHRRGRGIT